MTDQLDVPCKALGLTEVFAGLQGLLQDCDSGLPTIPVSRVQSQNGIALESYSARRKYFSRGDYTRQIEAGEISSTPEPRGVLGTVIGKGKE